MGIGEVMSRVCSGTVTLRGVSVRLTAVPLALSERIERAAPVPTIESGAHAAAGMGQLTKERSLRNVRVASAVLAAALGEKLPSLGDRTIAQATDAELPKAIDEAERLLGGLSAQEWLMLQDALGRLSRTGTLDDDAVERATRAAALEWLAGQIESGVPNTTDPFSDVHTARTSVIAMLRHVAAGLRDGTHGLTPAGAALGN
jgi:hypothetical protein